MLLLEAAGQLDGLGVVEVVPRVPHGAPARRRWPAATRRGPGVGSVLVPSSRTLAARVGADLEQHLEVLPAAVGKPGERALLHGLLEGEVALEEEVELRGADPARGLEHLDGHLQRQGELVALKEGRARIGVHVVGQGVDDVVQGGGLRDCGSFLEFLSEKRNTSR